MVKKRKNTNKEPLDFSSPKFDFSQTAPSVKKSLFKKKGSNQFSPRYHGSERMIDKSKKFTIFSLPPISTFMGFVFPKQGKHSQEKQIKQNLSSYRALNDYILSTICEEENPKLPQNNSGSLSKRSISGQNTENINLEKE